MSDVVDDEEWSARCDDDIDVVETLSLIEQAHPVIGDAGPYERQRQGARERRRRKAIPEWFSAEDLIAAPWEAAGAPFV